VTTEAIGAPLEAPKGKLPLEPALSYSPAETATYLGVTTQTLAKWRCAGRGPSYMKIGRAISYRGRDILAFEARCLVRVGEAA
jgi:hypothetical protein